jgi:hypothetical protein
MVGWHNHRRVLIVAPMAPEQEERRKTGADDESFDSFAEDQGHAAGGDGGMAFVSNSMQGHRRKSKVADSIRMTRKGDQMGALSDLVALGTR